MRLKNNFFFTFREDSKDEDSRSGNLLVRAGYIKKTASGIYTYLPLGFKTVKNIERIVSEEMDREGALQLTMPSLLPMEVYESSGRKEVFGHNMFSLKDRYEREYALGPTHEEMFVEAAKDSIKSYKDMPINLYQIAPKYRDETRPRYGLIRVREFVMKDAYSFDRDLAGLDVAYIKMFNAYKRIFDRCGINYKIVTADTGAMGGLLSEEFQAITDIGEDILVLCDSCDYASNIEISAALPNNKKEMSNKSDVYELLSTPNVGTIKDFSKEYNFDYNHIAKTLICKANDKFYACIIKGDRELNLTKVAKLLNVTEVSLAETPDVEKITNAKVGFAGPINLNIPLIVDEEVMCMEDFVVGANKSDYHYINVSINDFNFTENSIKNVDIKHVNEGDICPKCGGKIYFKRGIEIGNTFKLGTKYSEKLGLYYSDQSNKQLPVVMGCYGIGIGRMLAALIEQTADEEGIKLPINIAPYKVSIIVININDTKQMSYAEKLYTELTNIGIDTIFDDRDERPGIKFKDMDLVGIPIRITIGKKIEENTVEFKLRSAKENTDIKVEEVINKIKANLLG